MNKTDKYIRSTIIFNSKDNWNATNENINKWSCQVFLNITNPNYDEFIKTYKTDFVRYIIGDTREQVAAQFETMNKEAN